MVPKIASALAPIGAILAGVYSSLTGYSILREIGSVVRADQTINLPSGHVVGAIGLVLFGLGITAAAFSRRTRSTFLTCLLMGGGLAFLLAVLLIAFGNWQLSAAFGGLATAEQIDFESFMREVATARLPLILGWSLVVAGAVAVFAASGFGERDSRPRAKSILGSIAITIGLCALFAFVLSAAWSIMSADRLEAALATPAVKPTEIASGVTGVILSTYLTAAGIAGCAAATFCLSVATAGRRHTYVETNHG